MTDLGELTEKQRTGALAEHLLNTYAKSLIDRADRVTVAPGIAAAAITMDHRAFAAFIIEVISEAWFFHPELLGLYVGALLPEKAAEAGMTREDYDELARPSTFIIAATLAGTLDTDHLREDLLRMGLEPSDPLDN